MSELEKLLQQSQEDVEAGRMIDHEDIKEEVDSWSDDDEQEDYDEPHGSCDICGTDLTGDEDDLCDECDFYRWASNQ